MEDTRFDNLVIDIITLFIDKYKLKVLNIQEARNIILDIIFDFNRNCFCDDFLLEYLLIYLEKINPNFNFCDQEGFDDFTIINYREFFIVYLLILAKYTEDKCFLNRDISDFYNISITRINKLELFILKNINWDLSIKNQLE